MEETIIGEFQNLLLQERNSDILTAVYSLFPLVSGRKYFIPIPTLNHENVTVEDSLL
jgi:hypothetical protein